MDDWKIPLYKIYSDDEDLNLITKIIKRGNRWALGPEIEELENAIKNYVGVDYCISLNSGTSALHATLLAYDIGKNSEVIVLGNKSSEFTSALHQTRQGQVVIDLVRISKEINTQDIQYNGICW